MAKEIGALIGDRTDTGIAPPLNSMAYAIAASIGRRADTEIGPYMPDGFSQL